MRPAGFQKVTTACFLIRLFNENNDGVSIFQASPEGVDCKHRSSEGVCSQRPGSCRQHGGGVPTWMCSLVSSGNDPGRGHI